MEKELDSKIFFINDYTSKNIKTIWKNILKNILEN